MTGEIKCCRTTTYLVRLDKQKCSKTDAFSTSWASATRLLRFETIIRSVASIYAHTPMRICTAKPWKNILDFLKKQFLSLNQNDLVIHFSHHIGVFVLGILFILLLFNNSDGVTGLFFS